MKLLAKQIREIAQLLEAGMKVFLNRVTLEYRSILDWDDMVDPEPWEEEMEKIDNEWADYIVLSKMESRDAFRIMQDFLYEIDDQKQRENLIKILGRKSPFANFKAEIESSDYRQKWFDFRAKRFEDHVREQLDDENIKYE
jgi:hypothetical protein